MNIWAKVGITVAGVAGVAYSFQKVRELRVKVTAFQYALRLVKDKGMINLGAGPHYTFPAREIAQHPAVRANVDVVADGLPAFHRLDIGKDRLPFSDKAFDCCWISHVLEHTEQWQFALSEAARVADHVVVVLPHPASLSARLVPEHKHHFSHQEIAAMQSNWRNIEIFV